MWSKIKLMIINIKSVKQKLRSHKALIIIIVVVGAVGAFAAYQQYSIWADNIL